jgi:hypothetical protein
MDVRGIEIYACKKGKGILVSQRILMHISDTFDIRRLAIFE